MTDHVLECCALFLACAFSPFAAEAVRFNVGPTASCNFGQGLSIAPSTVAVGGRFTLTWCDPSYTLGPDASFGVSFYRVKYGRGPQGPWTPLQDINTPATSVQYTTDSTDIGDDYFYIEAHGCTVTIVGGCPPNPETVINSNVVKLTTGNTSSCQFDHSLSISSTTVALGQPFFLRWCDASTSSLTLASYEVFASRSSAGPWTSLGTTPPTANQVALIGRDNSDVGTTYFYVQAHGCVGGLGAKALACTIPNTTLNSNVAAMTVTDIFNAAPSAISSGQSAMLLWRTAPGTVVSIVGFGTQPASGSLRVTPTQTTTYTLTLTDSNGTSTEQAVVQVITQPLVVISAFPRGLAQQAGIGGVTDRFVVRNIGGSPASVSLSTQGSFFAVTPTTFSLAADASQTVTITGTGQPAGAQQGTVSLLGTGVPAGTSVAVRLISTSPAAGPTITRPAQSRLDVSSTTSGSITFRNQGTSLLEAVAVSDAPWLTPESGVISIAPGQTRAVSFTIDPARRSPAQLASETASMTLVQPAASSHARGQVIGLDSGTQHESGGVSIVYTSTTPATPRALPALQTNELGYLLPALSHSGTLIGHFLALNRPSNNSAIDISLYYLPASFSGAAARIASFIGLSPSSMISVSDIVKNLYGTDGIGSIHMRATRIDKVSVAANVFQTGNPLGLYGSVLPAFRSDRGVVRSALTGLRKDGASTTTIYVQEASGVATTVRTDVLDANGATVSSRVDNLGPFALLEEQNAVADQGLSALVSVVTGGSIVARALAIDATTGDVSDIIDWNARSALQGSEQQVIPYGVRQTGNPATTTQVAVFNSGNTTLTGTFSYVATPVAGRRRAVVHADKAIVEPTALTFSLGPLQSRTFSDLISDLDPGSSRSNGYLTFIPSSGQATISARLVTTSDANTFSSTLPIVGTPAGLRKGQSAEFAGLEDAGPTARAVQRGGIFRLGVAFSQPDGNAMTIRATLHFTPGAVAANATAIPRAIVSKDYTIPAGGAFVVSDLPHDLLGNARSEVDDLHDMQLDLSVVDGDGVIIPVVLLTENATGDVFVRLE